MPLTPLYYEAKEELANVQVDLTDEQERQRQEDQEVINAMDGYYGPHRDRWRRAGALYNLVQTGTNDVISNWYLGWARILINHSTAMLSAGIPEGDYEPIGPSDHKKKILWNNLTSHALNKSNWYSHQRRWIQDLHITGNAVTKNYAELPMRRKIYEQPNGDREEIFTRDFRRAKVGMRVRSPFRCMRSHMIIDPDEVRIGVEREQMPWNVFAVRIANAILPDGTKKYDTEQMPVGSHVQLTHIHDEDANELRTYALSYGGMPDETYPDLMDEQLGYPILNTPLTRYKRVVNGDTIIGGANVAGLSPLTFAIFDDQLDGDYETHATCGMGIPDIIEGPEAIMQALVNMTIDNVRLKNTVPISYKPLDDESPSGFDIDVRTLYSGLMIDGDVRASPLGVADVGANTVMWEWLKTIIYQLTGVNPEQLTGDNIKTAYQSGLLLRQMNMRAKDRLTAWENGPFKRMWTLLLADCLSELTREEWEELTEDEAEEIEELIGADKMTGEDYKEEDKIVDGKKKTVKQRRVHFYFPVKGHKFREDFTGENKKRILDFDTTQNTLVEDEEMEGEVSYIPSVAEYLFPTGRIESIMEFDVRVHGKGMMIDLQTQDMATLDKLLQAGITLKPAVPEIDLKKQYIEMGKVAGKEESDIMETDTGKSSRHKEAEALLKKLEAQERGEVVMPENAVPVPPPPAQAGGQAPAPPSVLQDTEQGLI